MCIPTTKNWRKTRVYEKFICIEKAKKKNILKLSQERDRNESLELWQAKASRKSSILSKKVLKSQSQSVHERLYSTGSQKNKKIKLNARLCQTIDNVPANQKQIRSTKEIDRRLMDDARERQIALWRHSDEVFNTIEDKFRPQTNKNSKRLVFEKFGKEYNLVMKQFNIRLSQHLKKTQLIELMTSLEFFTLSNSKSDLSFYIDTIWDLLGGNNQKYIVETSVFNLCWAIMNFDLSFMFSVDSELKQHENTDLEWVRA